MAKRISDIAKDLGITSKAIIDKCLAEGVPSDKVKGHMSTVGPGLEASIREWFSTSGAMATTIETTEHVNVEKVKAKPRKRGKAADGGHHEGDEGGGVQTAVAEPPPAVAPIPAHPVVVEAPVEAPVARAAATTIAPVIAKPVAPPEAEAEHAPVPHSETQAEVVTIAAKAPAAAPPEAPRETGPSVASVRPTAPPPVAPTGTAPAAAPTAPVTPPSTSHKPVVKPPPRSVTVAPMNVPTRPKVVAPAGPQLQVKQSVTLKGPKVIRVEAADTVSTPGPRRAGPGGPPSRGGRGVIGSGTDAGDARSPRRRTDRRTPGGAEVPAANRRRGKGAAEEVPNAGVFREQDLVEREARLARAGGYLKQRRRELKARSEASGERAHTAAELGGRVQIKSPFTIKELAEATGIKSADILKKLFLQGVIANVNSGIDSERAAEIMIDFDIELEVVTAKTAEEVVSSEFTDRKALDERSRAPVVTIMGHVDHGKTSLLDKIRSANVAAGEAGGITQKTSAFRVPVKIGDQIKHIVFLDTPGHQAFTEMRSRGANLTDIVVLVVSAPDGVMPQTVESITHAKAAKVPIVVALNKIDSPQATENQIQKIYGQLAEKDLNPTQWGGSTEVVPTSAIKGTGIQELLETLDLQAQLLDLKADFAGNARGRVVEATRDEGRGPLATVLVQDGEIKVGDFIVVGRAFGRVRDITDDQGNRLKTAGPSMPVQVSGIDQVPNAGDPFFVTDSLRKAEEAAEQRRDRDRAESLHQPKVTLDSMFSKMKHANVKEILIVLKADVQGSVDVIRNEIERLSTDEVKVRVLSAAVGGISEADVLLADASKAVIVGFNVIPANKARSMADERGVEIRTYQVIYDITEDVKKAASGLLEPEIRQDILGHADVRQVFKVTRVGTIAGCYVTDGMVQRDALIRVTRNGVVIENDRVLEQLKRFKDDAKDVKAGMECGMKIVGYDDIKEGDVLECYKKVEVKRTL